MEVRCQEGGEEFSVSLNSSVVCASSYYYTHLACSCEPDHVISATGCKRSHHTTSPVVHTPTEAGTGSAELTEEVGTVSENQSCGEGRDCFVDESPAVCQNSTTDNSSFNTSGSTDHTTVGYEKSVVTNQKDLSETTAKGSNLTSIQVDCSLSLKTEGRAECSTSISVGVGNNVKVRVCEGAVLEKDQEVSSDMTCEDKLNSTTLILYAVAGISGALVVVVVGFTVCRLSNRSSTSTRSKGNVGSGDEGSGLMTGSILKESPGLVDGAGLKDKSGLMADSALMKSGDVVLEMCDKSGFERISTCEDTCKL